MTQVTGTLTLPDGTPAAGASVVFELVGADRAFVPDDDETVLKQQPTSPPTRTVSTPSICQATRPSIRPGRDGAAP
jgi:hypothetical protein